MATPCRSLVMLPIEPGKQIAAGLPGAPCRVGSQGRSPVRAPPGAVEPP
jgi:hypothetical protein